MATKFEQDAAIAIRKLRGQNRELIQAVQALMSDVSELRSRPRTIQEDLDSLPGRRMETILSGEIAFTTTDEGKRGLPVVITISQDGPFIQTHWPLILWRPTAPDSTQNLNRWRPVSSFPLPTQEVTGDIIDIKYEMFDAGSQREFQNEARGPIISRPDNVVPLPIPTEWSPDASIRIYPTYLNFNFTGSGDDPVPPTDGVLYVGLPGYRICNL